MLLGLVVLAISVPKEWIQVQKLQQVRAKAEAAQAAKAATGRMTEEQLADSRAWAERLAEMKPDATALQKEVDERRSGYLANVMTLSPVNVDAQATYLLSVGILGRGRHDVDWNGARQERLSQRGSHVARRMALAFPHLRRAAAVPQRGAAAFSGARCGLRRGTLFPSKPSGAGGCHDPNVSDNPRASPR